MEQYISIFILIPLIGFLITILIPKTNETRLSQVSFIMMGLQFVSIFIFTFIWISEGCPLLYKKQLTLLEAEHLTVYIDFMYDWATATYLLVGAFIGFLITAYSRNYLHRETGFKRFFNTILFFYLGYNVIVLSCNLTSIFVGWEIAGIASFLLIAYYRNRYIPVKNAMKIFSLYRLGDISIILAMWFLHHIFHKSISINVFDDVEKVIAHINLYPGYAVGFSICVFTAAAIKSAQFPFSTWLPRAMEGPTPSSAIFYSSLAVHLGLLFLLRTYNFWVHVPYMRELVIFSGAFSFIISAITSQIQPSIKGQIAYSIIGQVGIMVIEVALGFHTLALIHFASHAMLRSYQLLISPSIVSYSIRKQFFSSKPKKTISKPSIITNFVNSIYIMSLNEWHLERLLYQVTWGGFKKIGLLLHKIPSKGYKIMNQLIWVLGPMLAVILRVHEVEHNTEFLSTLLLFFALLYALKIFTEKESARNAWADVISLHLLISCALIDNDISFWELSFYVGGVLISYLLGQYALNEIRKKEVVIRLNEYQGHCYEHPTMEFFFLISCLGLMGFPITSAFIGTELLFNTITSNQILQLILLSLVFYINGLSMIRIYGRVFLGPHIKTYHESARRTS